MIIHFLQPLHTRKSNITTLILHLFTIYTFCRGFTPLYNSITQINSAHRYRSSSLTTKEISSSTVCHNVKHVHDEEGGSETKNNVKNINTMNRREYTASMFSSLIAFSAFTSNIAISQGADDSALSPSSLEDLKLGKGVWTDSNNSPMSPSASSSIDFPTNKKIQEELQIPPSFINYASRILMKYDPAVQNWFFSSSDSNVGGDESINNNSEQRTIEDFCSLYNVVQDAIIQFLTKGESPDQSQQIQKLPPPNLLKNRLEQLYLIFSSKYATTTAIGSLLSPSSSEDETALLEIERHIAIMFTFLPPNLQPIEKLKQTSQRINQNRKTNLSTLPTTSISNNRFDLLPFSYTIKQSSSSSSYELTPSLSTDSPVILLGDGTLLYSPSVIDPSSILSSAFQMSQQSLSAQQQQQQQTLSISSSSLSSTIASSYQITRTRPTYSPAIYALFGLAGGLGCALTHSIVIPLDVVKTRMQTDPNVSQQEQQLQDLETNKKASTPNNNIIQSTIQIYQKEGLSALFLGSQATILGYLWYGVSVYPSYTFFKRSGIALLASSSLLASSPLDGAQNYEELVSLISGALSAVIASIGLTPMEACRIRAVADPKTYRSLGMPGTAKVIASESSLSSSSDGGWRNLYAGFPSLVTRQVVFGSIKFLTFEKTVSAIYQYILPSLFAFAATTSTSTGATAEVPSYWTTSGSPGALFISLCGGAVAGCVSSIISQPADSVLTFVAQNSDISSENNKKALGVWEGSQIMIEKDGVSSLFRGVGSRCVWAGSIIAGQFLLYDIFRAMFGVDKEGLKQVFQIVIDS